MQQLLGGGPYLRCTVAWSGCKKLLAPDSNIVPMSLYGTEILNGNLDDNLSRFDDAFLGAK